MKQVVTELHHDLRELAHELHAAQAELREARERAERAERSAREAWAFAKTMFHVSRQCPR